MPEVPGQVGSDSAGSPSGDRTPSNYSEAPAPILAAGRRMRPRIPLRHGMLANAAISKYAALAHAKKISGPILGGTGPLSSTRPSSESSEEDAS